MKILTKTQLRREGAFADPNEQPTEPNLRQPKDIQYFYSQENANIDRFVGSIFRILSIGEGACYSGRSCRRSTGPFVAEKFFPFNEDEKTFFFI